MGRFAVEGSVAFVAEVEVEVGAVVVAKLESLAGLGFGLVVVLSPPLSCPLFRKPHRSHRYLIESKRIIKRE